MNDDAIIFYISSIELNMYRESHNYSDGNFLSTLSVTVTTCSSTVPVYFLDYNFFL